MVILLFDRSYVVSEIDSNLTDIYEQVPTKFVTSPSNLLLTTDLVTPLPAKR